MALMVSGNSTNPETRESPYWAYPKVKPMTAFRVRFRARSPFERPRLLGGEG